MFGSSSSLEREINEYQDVSSGSGGSYESGEGSSSGSSSSDEHYSSGVPGFSLEEIQEMQRRTASRMGASSSRRPPSPLPDVEEEEEGEDVIYSCAPEIASTLDKLKLKILVNRYQIPKEFRPRLPNEGEWCFSLLLV